MTTGVERLRESFARNRTAGRKVLVPYLTCGDPDMGTTLDLLGALVEGGADIIELGVPFSDPMADGPVIQQASERALEHPFSMDAILDLVARFTAVHDTPLILFGYYNPFFRYGEERLAARLAEVGGCGVLCVDLPPEEAGPMVQALRSHGLAFVPLVTPVSDDGRIDAARSVCDAFGYYVSVTGVTGVSLVGRGPAAGRVRDVRSRLDRPLVVGFGVRTPADAARLGEGADGVVVGSALVQLAHDTPLPTRAGAIRDFTHRLKAAV